MVIHVLKDGTITDRLIMTIKRNEFCNLYEILRKGKQDADERRAAGNFGSSEQKD